MADAEVSGPSPLECEVAGLKQRVEALEQTQGIFARALGALGRDVNNLLAWVKLSEKKREVKVA